MPPHIFILVTAVVYSIELARSQVRGGGVSGRSPRAAEGGMGAEDAMDALARVRGGRTSDTGTSTCTIALIVQQKQRS